MNNYEFILSTGRSNANCIVCYDTTTFISIHLMSEDKLIDHIIKHGTNRKMNSIYIMNIITGSIEKYCSIKTNVGEQHHQILSIEFNLPTRGKTLIHNIEGKLELANETSTILYGTEDT